MRSLGIEVDNMRDFLLLILQWLIKFIAILYGCVSFRQIGDNFGILIMTLYTAYTLYLPIETFIAITYAVKQRFYYTSEALK